MPAGEIEQGVFVLVGDEHDRPAVPPVAAIRAAFGDVFFAPERNAPIAPVAGLDVDDGFVNEHA
jgi:hypothetical protein